MTFNSEMVSSSSSTTEEATDDDDDDDDAPRLLERHSHVSRRIFGVEMLKSKVSPLKKQLRHV
jgi:hypothetical protein